MLVGAGVGGTTAFYIFAGISLAGAAVASLVPRSRSHEAAVLDSGTLVAGRSTVSA